jgi:hypothetical protein
VMLDRTFQHFNGCQPDRDAADMLAVFLAAWEESISTYESLLDKGIDCDDVVLARDATYARLLKAGQTIHWIGGAGAVQSAARLMARQIPGGEIGHFGRLWSGLLPNDQA